MPCTLTYDEWLNYVFDRPIAEADDGEDAWYWQEDETGRPLAWWLPEPMEIAEYLIRMMESPAQLLTRFTEMQVRQALRFVFGCASFPVGRDEDWFAFAGLESILINYVMRSLDSRVPNNTQVRLIRSIYVLNRDLFAPNCSNWFGLNRDPPLPGDPEFVQPLDDPCWMLWDMNDLHQVITIPRFSHLVEPAFEVLDQTLQLNSANCQAAALHALGHLQPSFPERVAEMIDDYVARSVNLHPNLIRYAADARAGKVN